MLGADMMFKAMGLDPEEIKANLQKAQIFAQEKVAQLEAQLQRIEANQLLLYQLMSRKGLIETVEEYNAACEKERQQTALLGSDSHGDGKPN